MNTLKEEFEFYKENQTDLVKKYKGKFIVIKERKVIGAYDSEIEAYTETQHENKLGTFLIQKVDEGIDNYTQTFCSRVTV